MNSMPASNGATATVVAPIASSNGFRITMHSGVFDWTKGVSQKKASSLSSTSLPRLYAAQQQSQKTNNLTLTEEQISKKVAQLIDLAQACQVRVPEFLSRESKLLGASDFARLMNAIEAHEDLWFAQDRYYVFRYPTGVIGSVWLAGHEVYNSLKEV